MHVAGGRLEPRWLEMSKCGHLTNPPSRPPTGLHHSTCPRQHDSPGETLHPSGEASQAAVFACWRTPGPPTESSVLQVVGSETLMTGGALSQHPEHKHQVPSELGPFSNILVGSRFSRYQKTCSWSTSSYLIEAKKKNNHRWQQSRS